MYYETRVQGLGARLILEADEVIASILEFPRLGQRVLGAPAELDIRRRILHTFGVELAYMLVDDDTVVILAVFHGSGEPGYWLARLRPRF